MQTVLFFVYGTLITGARSPDVERLLEDCLISRREAWARGRLYDLGPYPGMVPAVRRSERTYGQLLALTSPHRCLPVLDDYEDYDPCRPEASTYRRARCRVAVAGGGREWAWVYWYQGHLHGARRITGGDWRRWLGAATVD